MNTSLTIPYFRLPFLGRKLLITWCTLVAWLTPHAAEAVTFTLDKSNYAVEESIVGSWSRGKNDPKSRTDWIGIYTPTQVPNTNASLRWLYLNGTQSAPNKAIQNGSVTFTPGMPVGSYVARFFANDGYTELAQPVPFTVSPTGGPTPPVFVVSDFSLRYAVAGTAYSGRISGYSKDLDPGDMLAFSKVSGPGWLTIAADGTISGIPTSSSLGENRFVVRATDLLNNSVDDEFTIRVFGPGTARVDRLRILSYNLWHGWSQVNNGFRKGLDSIILSGADIVCTQETTDNSSGSNKFQAAEVARELGWFYASNPQSGSPGVISRYPIVSTEIVGGGVGLGARVRLADSPQQEVMTYSIHLDYQYYGPYEAERAGSTNNSVLMEELRSQRDEQATRLISDIQGKLALADQTPVFVCGDFNCPSHQDWTAAASSLHYGKVVSWPAIVTVTNAGLVDSFRQLWPDPFVVPGTTWSSVFVGTEPQDRIDYIFYKGQKLNPVSSAVFNTAVETTLNRWGDSTTAVRSNTWPSDHRSVITEFIVQP